MFDIQWNADVTYGEVHLEGERQFSRFNFEAANIDMNRAHFDDFEREAQALLAQDLVLPAYDYCLKCSHTFNLLDARGAISVTERPRYIARVRALARACAEAYMRGRKELGYPLLKGSTAYA